MLHKDFSMSEPENHPIKVLFVDDEENILKSLRSLLMEENYVEPKKELGKKWKQPVTYFW